jgi:GT2 family glycosyltransferase
VDDGSSDHTKAVCASFGSLTVRYVLQAHAGGTQAKSTGARAGQGEVFLFLDDDITVVPQFIESLVEEHSKFNRLIVAGTLHQVTDDETLLRALPSVASTAATGSGPDGSSVNVPFTHCFGGCFSIRRSDYFSLGMLQDPAPGFWPNWEDIDFAYRAHQQGFQFRQVPGTLAYHWDYAFGDLEAYSRRSERAARTAVLLFQKHPGLQRQIPMFRDKEPISLSTDSPGLLVRKLLRGLVSSPPYVFAMQRLRQVLEKHRPGSFLLVLLYRWIVSAHVYRGYRQGLRDLAEANA